MSTEDSLSKPLPDRREHKGIVADPAPFCNMNTTLSLPTLLSQALVAFTIEFDNEFEHQTPHRTTIGKSATASRGVPWLVSMVMWSSFMRFIPESGITVGKLQERTHIADNGFHIWLTRMEEWWGYVVVRPDPADSRSKPPRSDWVVRPTAGGRRAQEVWRPLFGIIEERWCVRFGQDRIAGLRESLWAIIRQFDVNLPEYLPVLGYGLVTSVLPEAKPMPVMHDDDISSHRPLSTLLSQVLLAFALEFERESDLSLAISANVLRLLGEEGVRVRDLPHLSGVSKEAISMAIGFLEKRNYLVIEPDPASRTKVVRLTPMGLQAQEAYLQLLGDIEARWLARYGENALRNLRDSLGPLVGDPAAQRSPLFAGLEPYPEGWRASVRKPDTLPHYPMVLHRGGFPDGS